MPYATQTNLKLIRKVIQQIVQRVHPDKIVLFGSYAYGQPNPNSDVDLLIVMESKKSVVDRAIEVSKSLRFYPFPMDIWVRTPREVRQRLRIRDPFFEEIIKKGKVLYEQ